MEKRILSRLVEKCPREATVLCIVCSTLIIIKVSSLHCPATASMRSAYALFRIVLNKREKIPPKNKKIKNYSGYKAERIEEISLEAQIGTLLFIQRDCLFSWIDPLMI
jgi:hypothetical protein